MTRMSNSNTTVHKGSVRPVRFAMIGPDGVTPIVGGTVPMSSTDNFTATPSLDPNNDRRVFITGANPGTADVLIGSGPTALVITVEVSPPPDLSHVELIGYDDEITPPSPAARAQALGFAGIHDLLTAMEEPDIQAMGAAVNQANRATDGKFRG